ncbi:MAG: hypothetical protein L3J17_01140 [Candidatus Jettenia sp.]|nr:MAG: hypothetical protein L3J17_01140 [Candidatus Jettenia sp.]
MMIYLLQFRVKSVGLLAFVVSFTGLFWFTGCTTQKEIVTTSHSHKEAAPEPVVTMKIERGITDESLRCITCHEERGVTHGWVADWEASAHARNGVGCEACHINPEREPWIQEAVELEYLRTDRSNCDDKRVHLQVIAGNCGKCHTKQYKEFMKSRHSIGWKRMLEYGHDTGLSKDIRLARCEQCHNIQFKCDSCHTRHTFSALEAKTPEVCRTCHTGQDHPHYDMYISSKHGTVYTATQTSILKESRSIKALRAPVCITCHMPEGNHDISFGLAYAPVGGGLSYSNREGIPVDKNELTKRRSDMLSVCNTCHSPSFAEKTLTKADTVHEKVNAVMDEAKNTIFELEKEGLIYLSDIKNAKTIDTTSPVHALILGSPQLYGGSRIERLFLDIICNAAVASKGAYHVNPNYTYLYGLAEMQKGMSDMKEEAKKLREEAEFKRKMGSKLR